MSSPAPLPPLLLAERVGSLRGQERPLEAFDQYGARLASDVARALPGGGFPLGASVLDFGCGVGRLLRHLMLRPDIAELQGCDIDERSVSWVSRHLGPDVDAFTSPAVPPMPRADGSFDVVLAVAVFSHLAQGWRAWLAELHRVLRPGGLLVATFMGPAMVPAFLGPGVDPRTVGMTVLHPDQPWDRGGPMVLHDVDWLVRNWGEFFECVSVTPSGFGAAPGEGQGIYVGRRLAHPAAEAGIASSLRRTAGRLSARLRG